MPTLNIVRILRVSWGGGGGGAGGGGGSVRRRRGMNVKGLAAWKITSGGGGGWGVIRGVGILVQQRTGWLVEYGTGGEGLCGLYPGFEDFSLPDPLHRCL